MFMRRRPLMRAAVIGGGAYVVGKKSAQRSAEQAQQGQQSRQSQQQDDEQNERIASLEQQQAQHAASGQAPKAGGEAPAADGRPAGQAAVPKPSMLDQLNQLNILHQQGALTDPEFTAAKAKLLGSG